MWGQNQPASQEPARILNPVASRPHSLIPGASRLATGTWRSLNRTMRKRAPSAEGDKCAWGCRGGDRASTRKTIRGVWTHRPLDLALRATRRTPSGTVVGGLCDPNSAFSAAVRPKLREAVCPRNSPRKTQHSTAARAGRLKEAYGRQPAAWLLASPTCFHPQMVRRPRAVSERRSLCGDAMDADVRRDRRLRPLPL